MAVKIINAVRQKQVKLFAHEENEKLRREKATHETCLSVWLQHRSRTIVNLPINQNLSFYCDY